ncbi:MAG: dephospho-CoA kinase [Negativicutes bacterium]|nr:dephospho-CoA kinase [Negativicutes bacterium]
MCIRDRVIDCDKLARQVIGRAGVARAGFEERFGEYIDAGGQVDRRRLADAVFNDRRLRADLEAIIHPAVRAEVEKEIDRLPDGVRAVIIDIPLLFEAGWDKDVDEIWLVVVSEETQLQRLIGRDGLTAGEAMARIKSQLPLAEKMARSDRVFDNEGEPGHLRRQLARAWHELNGEDEKSA